MKTTNNGFVLAFLLTTFLFSACGGGSGGGSMPNQSVSFGNAPTIVVGGTGTVSATATSSLPVSFASITSSVCAVSGSTVTGVSAGTCTISANQAGNATYDAAAQVTQSFSVTATLSGLVRNIPSGTAFVLSNTGGENITIPAGSASFNFPTGVANGSNYNVAVLTQPANPVQNCTVSNGTGTISAANVTNIIVDCSWVPTGSLANARALSTATLLLNGKVLIVGGTTDFYNYLASAELYDPATGVWTPTGSLASTRSNHTATILPNGKVLVVGGGSSNNNNALLASAELYDPATGVWTPTGSLANVRGNHTATLLPNGKVLVAGGGGATIVFANGVGASFPTSTELYDPATGLWTTSGSLANARVNHTATLLSNGKVLVVGGNRTDLISTGNNTYSASSVYLASAELYDPSTGLWTPTGSLPNTLYSHTATLLTNGKVLVAGGTGLVGAELYDLATGLWSSTGSPANARSNHTATLLPTGKVLVTGGVAVIGSVELYDPITGLWTLTGSLTKAYSFHTATLLLNGKVMVVAGSNGTALASAELYF